jgi:hypothetical protein
MSISRFTLIFIVCALAVPTVVLADDFASLADARKVADKAVALFRQEKIVEGYAGLKPYWPLPPVEIDNLANQTNTQWPMVKQRFGSSIATEFVEEKRVGESFARYVYLQKFRNHAIRWIFMFYKPSDRWVINSVAFDDRVGLLFEN